MIIDQNTITLFSQNGYHEEYTLDPAETGLVLPGSVVAVKSVSNIQSDMVNAAVVSSQASANLADDPTDAQKAAALNAAELLIVKENALVGGGINRPSIAGETIVLERAVTGDRYLVRAIVGDYKQGDLLYLTQTANGIYFTKTVGTGANAAPAVRAIAAENFSITNDIVDLKDESNPIGTGKNEVLNGSVVNLLRVRIA
ncbi:MAG: hypothetical protein LBU34_08855 [Planctomycetaceae bacterium]|jgi:hypothetical protein|nr:hypothetical protein [Planctomycetaceae bacterium]